VALYRSGQREAAEAEFAALIARWEGGAGGGDEARLQNARQWHARVLY
jgi:hypothetical protein